MRFDEDDIRYMACELPEEIKYYKYCGDFEGEQRAIARYLEKKISAGLRKRLELEEVIAAETASSYTYSFNDLLARIQKKYPAVGAENLEHIIALGNADYILRGGERVFERAAVSNILSCNARYLKEIQSGEPQLPVPNAMRRENAEIMRRNGGRAARYRIREWLEPDDNHKREGKTLRVHLPYPAICPEQSEITLHSSTHPVYISSSSHRTAYIEAPYHEGDRYGIEFSYLIRMKYTEPDPAAVSVEQPSFYTGEEYPQIRFTPNIIDLADELRGSETNPLLLARRAYDFVTENVVYSYMREYLCIEFIPGFALDNRRGDCGVMALLFITLCRAMGVPARWQSGSHVKPDGIGSHDWAQFYIAPYGWLYADPSFGGGALRSDDKLLWNHYFGNLDIFRQINCTEFATPYDPPKRYLRRDPYDTQSGEAEYEDEGLGFDATDRDREVVGFEETEYKA